MIWWRLLRWKFEIKNVENYNDISIEYMLKNGRKYNASYLVNNYY
jgi:hypothetical protein